LRSERPRKEASVEPVFPLAGTSFNECVEEKVVMENATGFDKLSQDNCLNLHEADESHEDR